MFDLDQTVEILGLIVPGAPALLVCLLGGTTLIGRRLSERATIGCVQIAITAGMIASLSILAIMLIGGDRHIPIEVGHWVEVPHYHFSIKFVFDRLSVPFAILSFMLCGTIGAFASRYMHREPGYNRFFVLYALFVLGMIATSLSDTIETLFAGWELVGLSSAMLVAFFHERPSPVRNGLRVWTVYRVSDAALLTAALTLHHLTGEGDFDRLMGTGSWPSGQATITEHRALVVGLLLLLAAAGKSALIPFSGWLPRAMEGPTPSSAVFYGALTTLGTLRTKMRRFSFSLSLASEAIRLAAFGCRTPWGVIVFLALETIPPWMELRARGKSTRVYALHMLLFVALMILGWGLADAEGDGRVHSLWAIVPLLAAVLIRSGVAPVHCWVTDLFEKATFGTALLYVAPLSGAYAVVRLVLPIAPDWVMRSIGLFSLVTVVYAAGMALVQREARRFFCYLFLSHSALVLVGLDVVNPIGLTGALCVWLSIGFSLGGFGLTLRALESRFGRLSLADFHGLYEHTPALAVCFALTGLASVGFPGTLGFVGGEMLVDGAVKAFPQLGIMLVIAAALNGIAVVRAYFWLFTGTRHASTVSLGIGLREWLAVLTLAALILGGGLYPQPGVVGRYHAAVALLEQRRRHHLNEPSESDDDHDADHHNETDVARETQPALKSH
ncbi:MAG: hypothetical protein EXS05_21535 [Planctomycetaceae bacterium]|nr:hypothetical protein [Planctomycetaceae bacterium]